jgi:hypothetical protein
MSPILRLNKGAIVKGSTLFVTRAGATDIRSLVDIKGKIIASSDPLSLYDFMLGARHLEKEGFYVYHEAKQVGRLYPPFKRCISRHLKA